MLLFWLLQAAWYHYLHQPQDQGHCGLHWEQVSLLSRLHHLQHCWLDLVRDQMPREVPTRYLTHQCECKAGQQEAVEASNRVAKRSLAVQAHLAEEVHPGDP